MANYKFRNVRRDDLPPSFWLSTSDVEKHLQNRIDMIVALLRRSKKYQELPDIKIQVGGTQASSNPNGYMVLNVVLPPAALESEASNAGEELAFIWRNRDEEEELILIEEIKEFFSLFSFTREDLSCMMSRKWQEENRVRPADVAVIKNYSVPRYRKTKDRDGKDKEIIVLFLDPMRVFHDMICEEGENPDNFRIEINRVKKIRHGDYEFRVTKVNKKKERRNDDYMKKDLDAIIRQRR